MPSAMARLLGEDTAPSSEASKSPKEDAAQDLIDAVKDGDAKAVALAFSALYEHCAGGEGDDKEEESEDTYEG